MNTIFALASAQGRAGVAVVRLSGPSAFAAVHALCGDVPDPRRASLRQVRDAGDILDQALVLTFAKGASFTGEESAELHLHGSVATIRAVLAALGRQPGLRLAQPGEFTRRALENGRLDLTQVEGLADLIDAETEAQRRQAMRVLDGAVGRRAEGWRRDLIRAAALIEATIDFADEDVPVDVGPEVQTLLTKVRADLSRELAGADAAERIRDGFEVAIVGRPNAGKSTLLNALAGREAALTSEYEGTTRDVIEVRMSLGGLAVTLLDTAGLRASDDPVERMGIDRAITRAERADLRIFLLDGEDAPMLTPRPGDLIVHGKADRRSGSLGLAVSGKTGQGLDLLLAAITEDLSGRVAGAGIVVRERQRQAVQTTVTHLDQALAGLAAEAAVELVADDLRRSIAALDSLVGRVDVEHLLDVIFASFCIGK
jgi:tRNA modification GTPase